MRYITTIGIPERSIPMTTDKDRQTAPIDFDAYIRCAERARRQAMASLFSRLWSKRRLPLATTPAVKPC
jgi:hypothetical protein